MARSLEVIPLTLKQANDFIRLHHRHHKPVVGHRFSLGARDMAGELHGCVVVSRPISRMVHAYLVAEVTRLCTDGTPNACSFLYAAAARAAKEMGFMKIQTYILDTEPGTSLKAAGWRFEMLNTGGKWNHSSAQLRLDGTTRRIDQPIGPKQRWVKELG